MPTGPWAQRKISCGTQTAPVQTAGVRAREGDSATSEDLEKVDARLEAVNLESRVWPFKEGIYFPDLAPDPEHASTTFMGREWDAKPEAKGGRRHRRARPRPGIRRSPAIRLRKHGCFAKAIEAVASGCGAPQAEVPQSYPSFARRWLDAVHGSGAKVLSEHRVIENIRVLETEGGERTKEVFKDTCLEIEGSNGSVVMVSLALYARLVSYATLRPRVKHLIPTLRSKARQYAAELKFSAEYVAVVLAGSVVLTMLIGRSERSAWTMLGGSGGCEAESFSQALEQGLVPTTVEETGEVLDDLNGVELAFGFPDNLAWGRTLAGPF